MHGSWSGLSAAQAGIARRGGMVSQVWQRADLDEAGRCVPGVPYSQDPELMMDVLKHGAEVEVLESRELRERRAQQLGAAAHQYRA